MSKILVVDDDPQFSQLLKFELEQQGYEVVTVHKKDEALQALDSAKMNLVLMDVFLTNTDNSLALLKQLKSDPKTEQIPIILMTNFTNDFFNETNGTSDFLTLAKKFVSKSAKLSDIADEVKEIVAP